MESDQENHRVTVAQEQQEEREHELIDQAYVYITTSTYPEGCTDIRKRVIRKKSKKFLVNDGELYYKQKQKGKGEVMLRYVHSKDEQERILHGCHIDATAGHMGKTRTIYKIKERFMWHGMVKDAKELLSKCDVCQRMNRKLTSGAPELHPIPVKSPWHMLGIDFIGPLSPEADDGSRYILTISDYFTKWVEAIPTIDKSASSVATALFKVFMRMGIPQVIISDQGREFNNELDSSLAELLGIKRRLTTPYHPQANGLDERFNQTLQNMLVKFVHSKKSAWSSFLDTCVFAYNTSRHESTRFTPFELMFGRRATLPIDIDLRKALPEEAASAFLNQEEPDMEMLAEDRVKRLDEAKQNILEAQRKQKEVYDKKHAKPEHYKVGQLVLKKDFTRRKRKGGKLEVRFLGPYTISKVLPHGTFELVNPADKQGRTIRATGAHLKLYNQADPHQPPEHCEHPSSDSDDERLKAKLEDAVQRAKDILKKHHPPVSSIISPSTSPKDEASSHDEPPLVPYSYSFSERDVDSITPVPPPMPPSGDTSPNTDPDNVLPPLPDDLSDLNPPFTSTPATSISESPSEPPAPPNPPPNPPKSKRPKCLPEPPTPPKSTCTHRGNTKRKRNSPAKNLMFKRRQMRPSGSGPADLIDLESYVPKKSSHSVKKWLSNELFQLDQSQKAILLSPTAWLTCDIVDAAQKLLRQQMPVATGFQDVMLGKTFAFEVQADEFVQILHNGHGHWLTISTIGVRHPEVLVYDSMYPSTSTNVKNQIASLLATGEKEIKLSHMDVHMDVQMQSGGYDCGLFAIAFATALALGEQPGRFLFDQQKMRLHLVKCLEEGKMTLFPWKKMRRTSCRVKSRDTVEVHCTCRMPEIHGVDMIECSSCKTWFHFPLCVSVPSKVIRTKTEWYCKRYT